MLKTRIELPEERSTRRAAYKNGTDEITEIYEIHDSQILDVAELHADFLDCGDPGVYLEMFA